MQQVAIHTLELRVGKRKLFNHNKKFGRSHNITATVGFSADKARNDFYTVGLEICKQRTSIQLLQRILI
jgi:hypothetical protein